jgi:hypothetical protein
MRIYLLVQHNAAVGTCDADADAILLVDCEIVPAILSSRTARCESDHFLRYVCKVWSHVSLRKASSAHSH